MLDVFRRFFLIGASFSLALNLILLLPALFMLQVFDRVLVSRSVDTLVLLIVICVGWMGVGWVLDVLRQRVLALAGAHMDRQAGLSTVQQLLETAAAPARSIDTQQLRDLATVRTFLTGPAVLAVFDSPWIFIYLAVITLFHPLLGAVSAVSGVLLVGITWLGFRLTAASTARAGEAAARAGNFVQSSLRAAEVIRAHGMGQRVAQAWHTDHQLALNEGSTGAGIQSRLSATSRMLRQGLQVALLAVGAWLVIEMNASPGITIAATILLGRLLAPLEMVAANWKAIIEALRAWQRLRKGQQALTRQQENFTYPAPRGQVDVEGVFFAPVAGGPVILRNLSFRIEPGEIIAIMGPSGSGKSTLARLLMGIWQPTSGKMRLDTVDLANWRREDLGRHVGYCPQDVQLLRGTVAQNIARFQHGDDEGVVEAAQLARCHELIARLPGGYQTEVGENGSLLSGGQRQRIALARALYGNPSFVVLDEPNANLDTDGERDLNATLADLRARAVTTVIITQRTQVVEQADRILVIKDGVLDKVGKRRGDDSDPSKGLQVVGRP